MNEPVEISSDSDDEYNSKPSKTDEMADILHKYISEGEGSANFEWNGRGQDREIKSLDSPQKDRNQLMYNLSDDDDDGGGESKASTSTPFNFRHENVLEKMYKEYNLPKDSLPISPSSSDKDDPEVKPITSKERKKLERETKNKEKLEKRLEKQRETERNKALKNILAVQKKNLKPEECVKFITAHLDQDLVTEDYGKGLSTSLNLAEVKYKLVQQVSPGVVTWTRQNQSHLMNDDGNLALQSQDVDTDEALLVVNYVDIVLQINENTLQEHLQSVKGILNKKTVFLAVVGLESYYRFLHNLNKNKMRADISDEAPPRQTKVNKKMNSLPKVQRKKIEEVLTEIQLFCNCSHRIVETNADLENLIVQFSKSIAQLPYKLQKKCTLERTDWFSGGENKDTVKVDKNGLGLGRLWSKVLTTFPLASLETSEAITSKYPSPSELMVAYDQCASESEGEQLLQDIQIRRAAGPLTSSRRIGPELSRKIYQFFNSLDGNQVL